MSDPGLVLDILTSILTAIERIERRFRGINTPDDFVSNDDGIDRLDGTAMMQQNHIPTPGRRSLDTLSPCDSRQI